MSSLPMNAPAEVKAAGPTVDALVPLGAKRMAVVKETAAAIVPYAQYGAKRIGKIGIVGVSLCVLSLITFFSGNLPIRQQLAEQSAELDAARVQATAQRTGTQTNTPDSRALTFVNQLPSINDVPKVMGSIIAVAAATGIELESGTYEYIMADGDSIARYQMTLPVTGTYPEVRQFIEDILADIPAIALESMRIERGKVSDQIISADLRFSLLLGSPS